MRHLEQLEQAPHAGLIKASVGRRAIAVRMCAVAVA